MDINYVDKHIELSEAPKRLKKLTATKFASILGLNKWSTPFQQWCEITHTYNKPFEDTKYTKAGKVIEPIIIQYLNDRYFLDVHSPVQEYGADYFEKTRGDFYGEQKVLGGMWDAKSKDVIVEIKTTSRAEDWLEDIPLYYKLQASLYAYLSEIDTVYLVCAFLNDEDYVHPEAFKPTGKNTIVRSFSMKEEYPDFESRYVDPALEWWNKYVLTGVSPDWDDKADAEYLSALRTKFITIEDDYYENVINDIEQAQKELEAIKAQAKPLEDKLKKNKDALKKYMQKKMDKNDTKCVIGGKDYNVTLSKTSKTGIDENALKKDGLLQKYQVNKIEYRMTVAKRKDEE